MTGVHRVRGLPATREGTRSGPSRRPAGIKARHNDHRREPSSRYSGQVSHGHTRGRCHTDKPGAMLHGHGAVGLPWARHDVRCSQMFTDRLTVRNVIPKSGPVAAAQGPGIIRSGCTPCAKTTACWRRQAPCLPPGRLPCRASPPRPPRRMPPADHNLPRRLPAPAARLGCPRPHRGRHLAHRHRARHDHKRPPHARADPRPRRGRPRLAHHPSRPPTLAAIQMRSPPRLSRRDARLVASPPRPELTAGCPPQCR